MPVDSSIARFNSTRAGRQHRGSSRLRRRSRVGCGATGARRCVGGHRSAPSATGLGTTTPARRSCSRRLAACSMRLLISTRPPRRHDRHGDKDQHEEAHQTPGADHEANQARPCSRRTSVATRDHARPRPAAEWPTLLRSSLGAVEDRPQLAARKRDEQPRTQRDRERERQQQQPIRRHRRGRHPRRVDQPEVGHARGALRVRRTWLADSRRDDQVFVVLLVDRVVAVQLRGLGLDLRRGLQRLTRAVVAGRVFATRARSAATWTSEVASMRLSSW